MDLAAQLVAGHKKCGGGRRGDGAEIVGQAKWLHRAAVNDL